MLKKQDKLLKIFLLVWFGKVYPLRISAVKILIGIKPIPYKFLQFYLFVISDLYFFNSNHLLKLELTNFFKKAFKFPR